MKTNRDYENVGFRIAGTMMLALAYLIWTIVVSRLPGCRLNLEDAADGIEPICHVLQTRAQVTLIDIKPRAGVRD
jgi:hypothetical protein